MLYLDVDGVLNPDEPSDAWPDFDDKPVTINHGGGLQTRHNMRLSRQMAAALKDAANGRIKWLSTWNEDNTANRKLLGRLGWRESLPAAPYRRHEDEDGEWWKFTVIKGMGPLPGFVWVDDELFGHPEVTKWVKKRGGLVISPLPDVGLTPDQIEMIASFRA